jgi:hypothetical protein
MQFATHSGFAPRAARARSPVPGQTGVAGPKVLIRNCSQELRSINRYDRDDLQMDGLMNALLVEPR